ncbi:hypothetical protein [Metabacillus litoralis]|uniref:hypothetical protein n=1 Tax=Metabacillus litoralis TaxID=152268 RepID=UPI00204180B5|nr:hypothetical protein [Metabacillus litoralis]MCM3163294.1 hypothetical protein [Metabacillus litoralis]
MRSWVIYALIFALVFTGGCSIKKEVDSKELPNTEAFQDEFTRGFLDSTKEVEDGYYLFRSKTDGYTMLYPSNAKISEIPYEKNGKQFESVIFEENNRKKNYNYVFRTTYETYGDALLETSLKILSRSVGYSGDFNELEFGDNKIYYAKTEQPIESENRKATAYKFFSYIVSTNTKKSIEYIYTAMCFDESTIECNIDPKIEEDKALKLMKSIEFNK